MYMQPLTGPEIQQLSIHDVLTRKERCWCCGGKRKVIFAHMDSRLVEVCVLKRELYHYNKYACQYLVFENDENGDSVNFCITPYTDMGSCNGMIVPIVSVEKFCDIYNDIENLDVSERTLRIISIVNNEIRKRCGR